MEKRHSPPNDTVIRPLAGERVRIMSATKPEIVTIRVVTAPNANASAVGDAHSWDGTAWRNSIDRCDTDGCGRVFIDCDSPEIAVFVREQLENDDRVVSYS